MSAGYHVRDVASLLAALRDSLAHPAAALGLRGVKGANAFAEALGQAAALALYTPAGDWTDATAHALTQVRGGRWEVGPCTPALIMQ